MAVFSGPEKNVSIYSQSGRNLYSLGVVQDGLVLNYDVSKFYSYPKSGNILTDLSGLGNNGTLVNGVGYTASNGGSLSFDGTNTYVQITGSIVTSEATFISWIKRDGPQDWGGIVFSRGTSVSGMDFNSTTNNIGYHWNDNTNTFLWNSGLTVPDLTWCMCAISVSSSSATVYLCQSTGITSATNNVSHTSTTLNNIKIGYDTYNSARHIKGNVSQVSIYNRALTLAEIQQNFDATKGRYGI